jgi:YndJ-like protein
MNFEPAERWTRVSATLGAVVWVLLTALAALGKAPLGVIELLLLFALLVITPLGLVLGRLVAPPELQSMDSAARTLQPLAAAMAISSFWSSPGWKAGALVTPWLIVCCLVALTGIASLVRGRCQPLAALAANIGRVDLAVAGGWLLLSRLGFHPLGVQEPIVLLTAVHFHYTGFATSLLAGAMAAFLQRRDEESPIIPALVLLVLFAPFAVAAGFVFSSTLKGFAAVVLSVSVAGLALAQLWLAKSLRTGTARAFLRVSATAVIGGMGLAVVYAIGDLFGRNWLLIPRMASTHGVLNGLGFVLLGLLGWLVEWHSSEVETFLS